MHLRVVVSLFLLVSVSLAADLKVRVVDSQSAAVGSARVSLYRQGESAPVAVRSTAGDGTVIFGAMEKGAYVVRVLAAGFAPGSQEVALTGETAVTVPLRVAVAGQTVTVTAAATPATGAETASQVSVIDITPLENLQPVETGEILRFAPGAIVASTGRRGSQTSLFVRGGDSDYNKVIVDGVPVNEPGGFFDFGVVSPAQLDRIELLRGSESTLYGSDAMTSVVQAFSRTGSTRMPLLTVGADGGTFQSAHGYASLSGARGRFDYNVFGDQFNTNGQGINDEFSGSLQGANVGYAFTPQIQLRLRLRHNVSRVGDQGQWNFSEGVALAPGDANLPPDSNAFSRQNNFLASTELAISSGSHWYHRFRGFEYNHRRLDEQDVPLNPLRVDAFGFPIDFVDFDAQGNEIPSKGWADYNRAGFNYQAEYWARSWLRTVFGYEFEDENGFFGDLNALPLNGSPVKHGLRRNHAAYGEELVTWRRFSLQAGARYVHNENFGDRAVPRAALSYVLLKGGEIFSGTRLRGSYSEGIKEPSFEDTFGLPVFFIEGNPNLKPEENRAFEAGISQSLLGGKYSLDATYFNNRFHDLIEFHFDPNTFISTFINLNKSMAHGAELTFEARPTSYLRFQAGYVYSSTQVLLAPSAPSELGTSLLRRPKHTGTLLASYTHRKFSATLGGNFVGRRPDSDFGVLQTPLTHDAGYARLDLGGSYAINRHLTAYAGIENLLDRHYEDALGYPALRANFRAGLRLRVGGE